MRDSKTRRKTGSHACEAPETGESSIGEDLLFNPLQLAREALPFKDSDDDVTRLGAMFATVYAMGRERGKQEVISLLPRDWEPDQDEVQTLSNPRRRR